MAGNDYGTVLITVKSGPLAGKNLSAMGEIKISSTGYKISSEVSVDHLRLNRSAEPVPGKATCDFDRGGLDWDALIAARFDLTYHETHAGIVHYITGAAFSGEAQESMKDGKLTGLEIVWSKTGYRRRAA